MDAVCPGGKEPALGGRSLGFPARECAWFKNKLGVFHVQNRLLKGVGGGTEDGSATVFVCLILVL